MSSVPVMHVIEPHEFLVPNSSVYEPQQPAPYGGTFTQSTFTQQTPPFPIPLVQKYPPTNSSGPPLQSTSPRAVTMPLPGQYKIVPEPTITHPLSYSEIRQEPRSVTEGGGRRTYIVYCVHPNTLNNRLLRRMEKMLTQGFLMAKRGQNLRAPDPPLEIQVST